MIQLKMCASCNEWNYYNNTTVFHILGCIDVCFSGRALDMTFSKSAGVGLPLFLLEYFMVKIKQNKTNPML